MDGMTIIAPVVAPELAGLVHLGLVVAAPVVVGPASDSLLAEIAATCDEMRRRFGEREPSAISELGPARALYHAFGIDPTRTRPSSEALLRRVLKRKPFPLVNNAVDWCNLSALRSHLSLGLYDSEQIRGPVCLRRGLNAESYKGVRKDEVHLEGRPALADAVGAFGNPTADSLRTSVTSATESLFLVVFAPATYGRDLLATHTHAMADGMKRHLGGEKSTLQTLWRVLP